jgi:hypothetical protein
VGGGGAVADPKVIKIDMQRKINHKNMKLSIMINLDRI